MLIIAFDWYYLDCSVTGCCRVCCRSLRSPAEVGPADSCGAINQEGFLFSLFGWAETVAAGDRWD